MSKQPINKFSTGAVSVSVFENTAKGKSDEDVKFFSVQLQKRYLPLSPVEQYLLFY